MLSLVPELKRGPNCYFAKSMSLMLLVIHAVQQAGGQAFALPWEEVRLAP